MPSSRRPPVRIDRGFLARGASAGFTALFLGGWLAPIVAGFVPALGVSWLVLVGLVGSALAGRQIGVADSPAVHGAAAAVLGFLLMIPAILIVGHGVGLTQLALPIPGAAAVGAAAGWLASRARDDEHRAVSR
jgi:hypothetical protein